MQVQTANISAIRFDSKKLEHGYIFFSWHQKKIAIGKFMLAMQVQKSDRMKPVLCPQFEERKFQHFDLRFS